MLSTETLQPADSPVAPPANPAANTPPPDAPSPAPATSAPTPITTPDAFIAALIAANFNFTALARTIPAATFVPLIRSPEVRAALDELIHFFESCATLRSAELRELALDHLATIIKTNSASPIETRRAATTILRASSRPSQPRQPRQPREPTAPREPRERQEPHEPHPPQPGSPRGPSAATSPPAAPAPAKSDPAKSAPAESVGPAAIAPAHATATATTSPSAREILTTILTRLAAQSDSPTHFTWINHAVSCVIMLNGKCVRKADDGFASALWPHLRKYIGHPAGQIVHLPSETGADASLEATVTFPKSKTRPTELALRFVLIPSPHSLTRTTWIIADIITTLKPTNTS